MTECALDLAMAIYYDRHKQTVCFSSYETNKTQCIGYHELGEGDNKNQFSIFVCHGPIKRGQLPVQVKIQDRNK